MDGEWKALPKMNCWMHFCNTTFSFSCKDWKRFLRATKYYLEGPMDWQITGRLEAGRKIIETSIYVNILRQTVSTLCKQFQNSETVVWKAEQCRKRIINTSQDRYLTITAASNRKFTVRQLRSELPSVTGNVVSQKNVDRMLNKKGFYV